MRYSESVRTVCSSPKADTLLFSNALYPLRIIGLNQDEKASGGMAGLTFLFATPMTTKQTSGGGSWPTTVVGSYLAADGINNLAANVKNAIVPVKKRSVVTEQYGAGKYTDTTDSLFVLARGEISQTHADTADARLGLGPNKDQIYLAATAMGELSFRQRLYPNSFLRDTYSGTYGFYVYTNGNIGSFEIDKAPRSITPAFCL